MTTYNTGNPLGSAAAKDLYDNAQHLDVAVNDRTNPTWADRFNQSRKTWYGIEKTALEAISAFGYITIDSFEDGAEITLPNQVLRWESNGEYYRWDGILSVPKVVPAGSTPESTGGVGLGAWVSVGDASLRAALGSASDDEGSSIVNHLPDGNGAVPMSVQEALRENVNVNVLNFVPLSLRSVFADGTYRPISSVYSDIDSAKSAYPGVSDLELTDSVEYAAIQQADIFCRIKRRVLNFPSGKFLITKTILRKSVWCGQYCTNAWSSDGSDYIWDGTGTVLTPYGAGNPQRWTDVDGNDLADYTPMVVSSRSGLLIEKMTFRCESSLGVWSTGMFYPGVRRQVMRDFDSMGDWSDAGVRCDATWSSLNTTLTALHPDIDSDLGLNEYVFDNCFITGVRGVYVKGTTRASSTTPWIWSPGGTSDINFNNCRLGNDGDETSRSSSGTGFEHDAVIPNTAGGGQGVNFINSTLRVSAKYALKLDHSSRIQMVNTYAETTSAWRTAYGEAINACTSNTSLVSLINDANGHDWYKDGVLAGSGSLIDWSLTRIVSKIRSDGRLALPGLYASASSSEELKLVSRSALIGFYLDNGTSQTRMMLMGSANLRPEVDGTFNLGSSSYGFNQVLAKAFIPKENLRPSVANTVNNGTSAFPWAGGNTQTAFTVTSDERAKTPAVEIVDEMLDAWSEVGWIQFKYLDRIEAKSDDARWHYGVIAQRALEAFERHGLDARDFGFLCHDEWEAADEVIDEESGDVISPAIEAGDRYGIRYEEALALEAALQRRNYDQLLKRVEALENKAQ